MSEEKKLVKQCKKRNSKAFNRLYDLYSPVLFAICLRYAADKGEAEDILQEAFLTIFNKIDSYKFEGSFEGWLKRVTVNTAINIIRTRNKTLKNQDFNDAYLNARNYDDNIISSLNEKEILKCINALPDGYRTVFNMYAIEGYKHKDIADILGIKEVTARSQFKKARMVLIKEIEKLEKRR